MPLYIIGDIQGCFDELQLLLKKVNFGPTDTLWLTGDLVARGPKSLETLRWVKQQSNVHTVLGNHDLHLLAVAEGIRPHKLKDKTCSIFAAPDRDELLHWLRHQPLLLTHDSAPLVMTHAGIYPHWSIQQAQQLAQEVEEQLQGPHYLELLQKMYSNSPDLWQENLSGYKRWRFIINAFTRMRFCHLDGRLDMDAKVSPESADSSLEPWFKQHLKAQKQGSTIAFGHWAALMGNTGHPRYLALDTGCVWGNHLTMHCWETGEFITQIAQTH